MSCLRAKTAPMVRLQLASPRSQLKHSTTELLNREKHIMFSIKNMKFLEKVFKDNHNVEDKTGMLMNVDEFPPLQHSTITLCILMDVPI